MNCFLFVDFKVAGGSTMGFATGTFDMRQTPVVGDYLILDPTLRIGPSASGVSFKISSVKEPSDAVSARDTVVWLVTCDDEVFDTASEAEDAMRLLEQKGFVLEPLEWSSS